MIMSIDIQETFPSSICAHLLSVAWYAPLLTTFLLITTRNRIPEQVYKIQTISSPVQSEKIARYI